MAPRGSALGAKAAHAGGAPLAQPVTATPHMAFALAPAVMSALASAGRTPPTRPAENPSAPTLGDKRARAPVACPDLATTATRGFTGAQPQPQPPAKPGAIAQAQAPWAGRAEAHAPWVAAAMRAARAKARVLMREFGIEPDAGGGVQAKRAKRQKTAKEEAVFKSDLDKVFEELGIMGLDISVG